MLKVAFAIWLAGAGLDTATSYDFTAHYTPNYYERPDRTWFQIREGNPMFAGLQGHPALMSASIAASDAVSSWAIRKWIEPHNRRTAEVLYVVLGGYRLSLGVHNMRAMHEADHAIASVPAPR